MGDSVAQEGSELTNQPFRWDQRLFTVLLRLSGIGEERNVVGDVSCENNYLLGEGALTAISELTGGALVFRAGSEIVFQLDGGREGRSPEISPVITSFPPSPT